MRKIFFFIFILSFISSKDIPSVKLGAKNTFDAESDNSFKYVYKGPGKDLLVIYFYFDTNSYSYDIDCQNSSTGSSGSGSSEKVDVVNQIDKSGTCTIKFEEGKGSFIIYTLNIELGIKLKNKYGNINLPIYTEEKDEKYINISQLTFSVPNLERDATVKFEYTEKAETSEGTYDMENPFKVCHGNDCQENIETYNFKKGESYKIMVKAVKKESRYEGTFSLIPGFTFYDENYDGTYTPDDIIEYNNAFSMKIKYLFISLILFLL